MPPRISLAMIAEKDAPTLGRCLKSWADLVNEIVIVTQPGASTEWKPSLDRYSPKLVELPWPENFAAARNESLRHATGEWAFLLDADEWLDDSNRERFHELRTQLSNTDAAGWNMTQVSPTRLGADGYGRPSSHYGGWIDGVFDVLDEAESFCIAVKLDVIANSR